jgi:hypothetical protein
MYSFMAEKDGREQTSSRLPAREALYMAVMMQMTVACNSATAFDPAAT